MLRECFASRNINFLVGFIILIFTLLSMVLIFTKNPFYTPLEKKDGTTGITVPNIIILLLDCVRADHLSCYGYSKKTTPHIDSLAAQGITFHHAISQASWTFPSVFSLLSGHYPHKHGQWLINTKNKPWIQRLKNPSQSIPLFPEFLQEMGYRTWGFSTNTYINEQRMAKRGFDEFLYLWKAPAMEVVNYGIEKIREAENTKNHFFCYLHFMDAHHPVQPPAKFYNFFSCSDGKDNEKRHEGWEFKKKEDQHGMPFENYREHKIALYDGSIRYMDEEIGRLMTELADSTLENDTIVIVLADHGDEFWDHADFQAAHYQSLQERQGTSHGQTLFQEIISVPLIITTFYAQPESLSSQLQQPATIEEVVPLVDLVPTLLDLIDYADSPHFDGRSLTPLISRNPSSTYRNSQTFRRSIFSESTPSSLKISLIEQPYKLIYAHEETNALYNLNEDPAERSNLIKEKEGLTSSMMEKIARFREDKAPETKEISLSRDELEELQALGYIEN